MKKLFRYTSFFGGIIITFLGLIIMLIKNDTGVAPATLIDINLFLVFLIGISVILYIGVNRGI